MEVLSDRESSEDIRELLEDDIRTGAVFRQYVENGEKRIPLTPQVIMSDGRGVEGRLRDEITVMSLYGFDETNARDSLEEEVMKVDRLGIDDGVRVSYLLNDFEMEVFRVAEDGFHLRNPSSIIETYGGFRMVAKQPGMKAVLGNASHSSITKVEDGLERRLYDEVMFLTTDLDVVEDFDDFSKVYERRSQWEGTRPTRVRFNSGDIYDIMYGLNTDPSLGYMSDS